MIESGRVQGPPRTTPADQCPYCERICPRCRYPIAGGFEHVEQVQPPGGSHFVCSLRRHVAPLVQVLDEYLTHRRDHVIARRIPPIVKTGTGGVL